MAYFRAETAVQRHLLMRARAAAAVPPQRLVLRGRIVMMNARRDVMPDGIVCIEDDRIMLVSASPADLPPPFDTAPLVETGGTIYPGLVELHNHPAYNVIPLWNAPERFPNRGVWRRHANYFRRVSNPAKLLAYHPRDVYPKALVRFVECRALLGGVTTTQGLTYSSGSDMTARFEGLVRNVEFPFRDWPFARDYINDFKSKADAAEHLEPVLGKSNPYIIHLCEGTDPDTRALFYHLQQNDGNWLIGPELITIHATALEEAEFAALAEGQSGGVVWSPLSNFLLYGDTTKVALAAEKNLNVALGSDWAPSGTKNLLGELKIARAVSTQAGGLFDDRQLVEAVTCTPAAMIGWGDHIGSVAAGRVADLLVVDSRLSNPYANLVQAKESDIIAVVIAGRPRAGRASVIDPRTPGVELLHVAGQQMVIDVIENANHPLAGVTLDCALATIRDALARLPDVAREAQSTAPLMLGAPDHWRPVLDYEEEFDAAPHTAEHIFAAARLPGPGDVDPMTMEPLTVADDPEFINRLKASMNLPEWLKEAL